MPIKDYEIRDGITARQGVRISAPFGDAELAAVGRMFEALGRQADFEGMTEPLEAWAQETLVKAGIPPDPRRLHALPSGGRGSLTALVKDRPFSKEWYAAEILHRLHFIRAFLERGEAAEAARWCLGLGALTQEADDKFEWEQHALRGLKTLESARAGHAQVHGTPERKAERRARYRVAYEAEIAAGAKSCHAACLRVGTKFGVSYKTIERAVKTM